MMGSVDYRQQNLQDRSFRGQDLTGADFSNSDLRGCDFTKARLVGANFAGARTGQSDRQRAQMAIAAVLGPLLLFGVSWLVVAGLGRLPSHVQTLVMQWLPIAAAVAGFLWRDRLMTRAPRFSAFMGTAVTVVLALVMVVFTVGLVIVGGLTVVQGSVLYGLFLLLLAGVFVLLTRRILRWVRDSLQSAPGTLFRAANLTDANFSRAAVGHTDFSLALLTGICIEGWAIAPYTRFDQVQCEYLYLDAARYQRQPQAGNFQPGEWLSALAGTARGQG